MLVFLKPLGSFLGGEVQLGICQLISGVSSIIVTITSYPTEPYLRVRIKNPKLGSLTCLLCYSHA